MKVVGWVLLPELVQQSSRCMAREYRGCYSAQQAHGNVLDKSASHFSGGLCRNKFIYYCCSYTQLWYGGRHQEWKMEKRLKMKFMQDPKPLSLRIKEYVDRDSMG